MGGEVIVLPAVSSSLLCVFAVTEESEAVPDVYEANLSETSTSLSFYPHPLFK